MAVNFISQLLAGIVLASFFHVVFPNENDGCPTIKVQKDQIIRTKAALDNGAKYLHKEEVESARECYKLCCKHDNCNLGMLKYKNDSNGELVRTCFLFDCGFPSKCTFAPYKHYATISFAERKKSKPKQSKTDYSKTKSNQRWDKDCPEGAPVAMCESNPCDGASCPRYPWAVCRPSTCGTCHAEFFNADGQRYQCYDYGPSQSRHSISDNWFEKNILKETKYPHQSNQHTISNKNSNLETRLQDYTKQNPNKQGSSAKEEPTDPPFHQWREFIDNNPKFGNPKLVTEKPTEKPTTFHQWREFIDNNPKYAIHTKKTTKTTKPTKKPEEEKPEEKPDRKPDRKPTRKPTRKPDRKPTRKPTKLHVIPTTKPATAEHPLTESHPKIDENSKRGNISDVVVIETSNLRIVENKAVVPLAIFLVVALVMLFVVVLRLRVMKTRLRRKAFATDDADYLINGMYL